MEPELPRTEWELDERMPRFDDMREFEVWMRNGEVRRVRRIGGRSAWIAPGTLVFTDCVDPLQNLLCHEPDVIGWRYTGKPAPAMPEAPGSSLWLASLAQSLLGYDARAHAAAYPGF